MLHLHQSNRMERLADALAALVERPAGPVLAPETVVVQHPGMARWLAMRLAEAHGVCAGVEFPLPAAFVWRLMASALPEVPRRDPLDRETLALRAYAALARVPRGGGFRDVRRYLEAEGGDPRRRWRLARRVADAWDRYLVYRPGWFEGWDSGDGEGWQPALWRLAGCPDLRHRARVLRAFLGQWQAGALDGVPLPPRVAVFGLTGLPPVYLDVFRALAERTEVHLFFHNPCAEYWGDVVSERARARIARDAPRRAAGMEAGNALLAAFGHHGRDMLHLLYEKGEGLEHEAFEPPSGGHLLARVQADVLALREGPEPGGEAIGPDDFSLAVHVCHSPMRECQVLKDRLLACFERLPGLAPREVAVLVPDIERYAPCIEAVFGGEGEPLPWSIADRVPVESEPLLRWLDGLLGLPESRFAVSEVLALLEPPALLRRIGVGGDALEALRRWLVSHHVHWGVDGGDWPRGRPGEPAPNSWAFGRLRMLGGYALPEGDAEGLHGSLEAAPGWPLDGQAADRMGRLWWTVDRLAAIRAELGEPRPLDEWRRLIGRVTRELLSPDEADEAVLQRVRDALDAVADDAAAAGLDEPVPVAVLREQLAGRLAEPARGGGWLAGGVTFATFAPLRSIPFRVVCLLGLEDASFPRNPPRPDFDLLREQRERGDRNARDDDRYAFLEALLSARDVLHLSYVGRDVRSGEARQPSVVIAELIDYLDRHYRVGDRPAGRAVVTEHPLQPFSARYFQPGAEPASYDEGWAAVARAALDGRPVDDGPAPATAGALPEEWSLEAMARFIGEPQRGFLEQRLAVDLEDDGPADEDDEPFALTGLEAHAVRSALLDGVLRGQDPRQVAAGLRAAGAVPHGVAGEAELSRLTAEAQALAARVQRESSPPAEPLDPVLLAVELARQAPPHRLTGVADALDAAGRRVQWRAGRLWGRHVLALWVWHLALAASGRRVTSVAVARDATVRLKPLGAADALARLADLAALCAQGVERPLPLLVESAWAHTAVLAAGRGIDKAEQALRKRLLGTGERGQPGECDDPAVRRLLGEQAHALALAEEGRRLAARVFEPLRDQLEVVIE